MLIQHFSLFFIFVFLFCLLRIESKNFSELLSVYSGNPKLSLLRNCSSLNLTNPLCEKECNIYLNIFAISNLSLAEFFQYYVYYSASSPPFGYQTDGNADLCVYYYGTYCYTPVVISGGVAFEHGCCVPGNCTGEDAEKVVKANVWCYELYKDSWAELYENLTGASIDIVCEIPQRYFDVFACFIIAIFFLFLLIMFITTVIYQWDIENYSLHFKNDLELLFNFENYVNFFDSNNNSNLNDLKNEPLLASTNEDRHNNNYANENSLTYEKSQNNDSYNSSYQSDNNTIGEHIKLPVMTKVTTTIADKNGSATTDIIVAKKNENVSSKKETSFVATFCVQNVWNSFIEKRNDDSMPFLDGMRWWSMTWVILGHAAYMASFSCVNNIQTVIPTGANPRTDYRYQINDLYLTIITQGFFAVDTFFWLSGLLGALSIYKLIKKKYKLIQFYIFVPLLYVIRYLRLAPIMIYVTLLNWKIIDQLPYSYHVISRDTYSNYCSQAWYKIFFLYANLDSDTATSDCMGQLWYVQCDYQMFLALPFVIMIFVYKPILGIGSAALLFIACCVCRTYEAFYYHFAANIIYPSIKPLHNANVSTIEYTTPWDRMGPYWAGVLLAFLFILINENEKNKNKKFQLTYCHYWFLQLIAAFILLCVAFWPYQDVVDAPSNRWGLHSNVIYNGLSCPAWGVGLSIFAFALRFMNTNLHDAQNVSLIKYLLSMSFYQPLAKLTYLMYLVHIMVYQWYFGSLDTSYHYDIWDITFLWFGVVITSLGVSFVLWIVMEKPISNIIDVGLSYLK